MRARLSIVIAAATAMLPRAALAAPACTAGLLETGVKQDITGSGTRWISTSRAKALDATESGRSLAETEARLTAKAALATSTTVPEMPDLSLRGVYDVMVCEVAGTTYVAVAVEAASAAVASKLSSSMENASESFGSKISPEAFDRPEFERLMAGREPRKPAAPGR